MSERHQVYKLDRQYLADNIEEDGVLRKDWYDHPELGKCLFKESCPSQAIITEARTDWTEKVVFELAKLLNLPIARYELADGYFSDFSTIVEGVISLNCIPSNVDEVFTGQKLLAQFVNYNADNPSQYTIENVLKALDLANVKPPSNWEQPIAGINTGAEIFVGYILLDTFVNNSD
jgi:hypothetical protein